jgi:hypothetical protein
MCERCVELDDKIAHLKVLVSRVTDTLALDGIAKLVERYETRKRSLHPEPEG